MTNKIDLHIHTSFSDGTFTPEEVIQHAKEKGLRAIAITDHDTTDGIYSAMEYAKKIGYEVIPGIEIGADYNPEMHILGYFPYGGYEAFEDILKEMRIERIKRNQGMIDKLNNLGYTITQEEVDEVSSGEVASRLHIAIAMKKKGYVMSTKEAFNNFLNPGACAYVKKDKMGPIESIKMISDNKGIAVIAHPVFLRRSIEELEKMIVEYIKVGLRGIEVYYPAHSKEYINSLEKLCEKYNLIATAGSDFHGANKPEVLLGTDKGYDIVERLKKEY